MRFLKILLYIALGIVALLLLLGLFGKKQYHIERSMEIDAPKSMVYEYVRHFKNFDIWSPWTALDPAQKTAVTGPDGQPGAKHSWSGNDNVGEGSQTITAVTPDRIDMVTEFIRPFKSSSPTAFIFEQMGNKTKVHWTFEVKMPFPFNGLMMFTDIDKGVGKDFEMGLENLKRVLEETAHRKYKGYEVAQEDNFAERTYYGIRTLADSASVGAVFAKNMTKTLEAFKAANIAPTGASAGIFYTWENGKTDMAVGLPAAKGLSIPGLQAFTLEGGAARIINYMGSYDKSGDAHYAMDAYMTANNVMAKGPAVEEYLVSPTTEPDTTKWHTKVIYFVEPKK